MYPGSMCIRDLQPNDTVDIIQLAKDHGFHLRFQEFTLASEIPVRVTSVSVGDQTVLDTTLGSFAVDPDYDAAPWRPRE